MHNLISSGYRLRNRIELEFYGWLNKLLNNIDGFYLLHNFFTYDHKNNAFKELDFGIIARDKLIIMLHKTNCYNSIRDSQVCKYLPGSISRYIERKTHDRSPFIKCFSVCKYGEPPEEVQQIISFNDLRNKFKEEIFDSQGRIIVN